MEIQIKKAIKAGNSSAVILPRAWLNKQVRVELVRKTNEIILNDTLEILKKHIPLNSIIGIYLAGSYARGEEEANSDIDILVITDDIDKEMIYEGIYNILIISQDLLYQKLKQDLFPVGQMLKEAKPLMNSYYLKNLDLRVTKENVKWYIDSTYERLIQIKNEIDYIKGNKIKYLGNGITYSIVLRIRTLEIIKRLIQNKNYSKKEFLKLIRQISGSTDAYEGYLASKNNLKEKNNLKIEEAERLYDYLKKDLEKVNKMVSNLK